MTERFERYGATPDEFKVDTSTQRPTGKELFDEMSKAEQDELLGPEKAQMVRDGEIELADLVLRDRQDEGRTFITAKPLEDL